MVDFGKTKMNTFSTDERNDDKGRAFLIVSLPDFADFPSTVQSFFPFLFHRLYYSSFLLFSEGACAVLLRVSLRARTEKMSGAKSVAFMNHKTWHTGTFQHMEARNFHL